MSDMWKHYVASLVEGESHGAAAERAKTTQPTIGRWINGSVTPTNTAVVAAFAQGYGRNVLEAFVAAGMLSEADALGGMPESSRLYLRRLARDAKQSAGLRTVAALDTDEDAGAPED